MKPLDEKCPTYPLTGGQMFMLAIYTVIICFGGLMIGVKIDHPEALLAVPMPILIIAFGWACIGWAYEMACHHIKNWYLRLAWEAEKESSS